jgi:D-lactate dehydrogenase
MKVKFFSLKEYEKAYLIGSNKSMHTFFFDENALSIDNAESCKGFQAISVFTNDNLSQEVLQKLKAIGVRYIAIRATGYDHADLQYANRIGLSIANVPEYSPYSVTEQTLLLMLALSRKIITAHQQLHLHNYTLTNLVGFELHQKTVGIIGMGRIGSTLAKTLRLGFGCHILAYDKVEQTDLVEKYGVQYLSLNEVLEKSDILSLHIPLNAETKYIIQKESIQRMKTGVMLINTGRGGLVNTEDVIEGLKNGKIGYFGADVYEKEKGLFFYDHSNEVPKDDTLLKLMSLNNVIITPHQGFLTSTALQDIANTTLYNIDCWASDQKSKFELTN